jgi:hypothetical protein
MNLPNLKDLIGVPDLISEVLHAFRHAPEVFTDPRFLAGLVKSGIDVALAPDDETRRETVQVCAARLMREFNPKGA